MSVFGWLDSLFSSNNDVDTWQNSNGQVNQKVQSGEGAGTHRGYNPKTSATFQAGTSRFTKGGKEKPAKTRN